MRTEPISCDRPFLPHHLTAEALLRLMHFNRPDVGCPRALIVISGGYDWEHRPIAPDPSPPTPPLDTADAEDVREHDRLWRRYIDATDEEWVYSKFWPEIPRRLVRRLLNRGWIADCCGRLTVTDAGHDAWHVARYGHKPGTSQPQRRSHKRRPQGQQMMFSRYRWHALKQNRNPLGPSRLHWPMHRTPCKPLGRVRRPIPEPESEPEPPPRKEWRRFGWAGMRKPPHLAAID
jgi:hypothetical protein